MQMDGSMGLYSYRVQTRLIAPLFEGPIVMYPASLPENLGALLVLIIIPLILLLIPATR